MVAVLVGYQTAYYLVYLTFQSCQHLLEWLSGFEQEGFAFVLQNVCVTLTA